MTNTSVNRNTELKEFAVSRLTASPSSVNPHSPESRTTAGLLMAALLSAFLVVADQVIETLADGHLLVSWVALWLVAFAALAWLAQPLRRITRAWAVSLAQSARQAAQRRTEAELWESVHYDRRTMQDLLQAWQANAA
jgi:hypothetical protein